MKQYIGTKIIEAEPAYRCMDGHGHITITDDLPVACLLYTSDAADE